MRSSGPIRLPCLFRTSNGGINDFSDHLIIDIARLTGKRAMGDLTPFCGGCRKSPNRDQNRDRNRNSNCDPDPDFDPPRLSTGWLA